MRKTRLLTSRRPEAPIRRASTSKSEDLPAPLGPEVCSLQNGKK